MFVVVTFILYRLGQNGSAISLKLTSNNLLFIDQNESISCHRYDASKIGDRRELYSLNWLTKYSLSPTLNTALISLSRFFNLQVVNHIVQVFVVVTFFLYQLGQNKLPHRCENTSLTNAYFFRKDEDWLVHVTTGFSYQSMFCSSELSCLCLGNLICSHLWWYCGYYGGRSVGHHCDLFLTSLDYSSVTKSNKSEILEIQDVQSWFLVLGPIETNVRKCILFKNVQFEGKETFLSKTHFLTIVAIGPGTKNQLCASWISKKGIFVKKYFVIILPLPQACSSSSALFTLLSSLKARRLFRKSKWGDCHQLFISTFIYKSKSKRRRLCKRRSRTRSRSKRSPFWTKAGFPASSGGRNVISELFYSKSRTTVKMKYLLRILGLLLNDGLWLKAICKNEIFVKNIRIVAQWWTLIESHLLK